jgi:hypothetical protein
VELFIVDRELKPKYLLESCPDLRRLNVEWQHELSQLPHFQFQPDWFSQMLTTPEWPLLASRLNHLVGLY